MPASTTPDGPGRRVAILAGTGRYDHPDEWDELDQVQTALTTVAGCLDGLGYRPATTAGYLLNPTKDELGALLRSAPADAEVVIAYYTGHGHVDGLHYLITRDSSVRAPGFITGSAIATRELPSLLAVRDPDSGRRISPQPYLLIIVDTCFSGTGAIQISRDELNEVVDPDRTWVMVSARPAEYAQQGAFSATLRRALAESTAGRTQPYVHPDALAGSINSQLPTWQRVRSHPPASGVEEPPPFFPNPDYQPVPTGLTLADQAHWVSRLRGTAEPASGYYITGGDGRTAAMRDIAGWISDPDRGSVAIVTGRPGSGKSALLALPALVTDLTFRESLLAAAGERPIVQAAITVRPDIRVIAVHGRGLNAAQLSAAIAGGLGRDAGTADDLLEGLERRPVQDHPVILLDALDETEQPGVVIGKLLTQLARLGVRLLIGTRKHLVETIASPSLVIDLDREPYADAQALTDYVIQLLVASHEPGVTTPYQPLQRRDGDTLTTIAAAVNAKAAGSFLIGQLIALALRGRDQVVGTGHLDDIPASVGAAFDADLARLGGWSVRARVLLTALAWAKGLGLPWENVWVPLANAIGPALATRPDEPLRDSDVRRLRDEAGAYIIEDAGPGGRSVFRPFHDLLAAHLRASGEAPEREAPSDDHRQRVNGLLAGALLSTVPADEAGFRLWAQAHPYLRSYLAQHAADAEPDRLTALLAEDPEFLAAADPATLVPLLLGEQPTASAEPSAVYRRAAPLLGADVRWNASYLQEASLALGAGRLREAFAAQRLAPAFGTVIARQIADASLLAIMGHTGWVAALAAVPIRDGRTLLASADTGGALRLWDPETSQLSGSLLEGDPTPLSTLAVVRLRDGRILLASGDSGWPDGTLRLWDPETGQSAGAPMRGHIGGVSALAAVRLRDGRTLLASRSGGSNEDAVVRLWDPETGQPAGPPLQGHTGTVLALAAVPLRDGRTLLASEGSDGLVLLWDLETGQSVGPPLEDRAGWLASLAAVPLRDGRTLLASGGSHGVVWLWDPETGQSAGPPLKGHTASVASLAAVPLSGARTLLASGDSGGVVRLWDPETGQPAGPPLEGHAGRVASLAAVPLRDGRTLLASGGSDGVVRLWNPDISQLPGLPLEGRPGPVQALAAVPLRDGRTLLASGGSDGVVRLWNPETGQPAGPPLEGHDGWVWALAVVPLRDGRTLLASGDGGDYEDGTVRLWDPETGQPAGPPLEGHDGRVSVLAVVPFSDGRTVLASGGLDGVVRLWDPETGQPAGSPLKAKIGGVHALAAVPLHDGRILLAISQTDPALRLWDLGAARKRRWKWRKHGQTAEPLLEGHDGWVWALAAVPLSEGRSALASGGSDGQVRLWEPETGQPIGPPLEDSIGILAGVHALTVVPLRDGRTLLAGGSSDATVRLWDLANGRLAGVIARRAAVNALYGWGDSFLAIGSADGLAVIDLANLPARPATATRPLVRRGSGIVPP